MLDPEAKTDPAYPPTPGKAGRGSALQYVEYSTACS